MKFKTNFEQIKKGIVAISKGTKKNALSTPLIKIEAKDDKIILTSDDLMNIEYNIPAEVEEKGVFITTISSINILCLRKCTGILSGETDNTGCTLLLKYKGNKASTILTKVDNTFEMPRPSNDSKKVSLPLSTLKDMCKETIFVSDDNLSSNLHSLKFDIDNDVDGLLKLRMSASDGASLAVRTAFAVKNGEYTGSCVLLPEHIKIALSVFLDDTGDIDVTFDNKKMFMESSNAIVSFPLSDRAFPDIDKFLAMNKCSFMVKVNKTEFTEALNCAIYLQNEQNLTSGNTKSVSINVKDDFFNINCVGLTQFSEKLEIQEKQGDFPDSVIMFNTLLLKELVTNYPEENLILSGTNSKSPFWMCSGEHDEYVYCIMPKIKR